MTKKHFTLIFIFLGIWQGCTKNQDNVVKIGVLRGPTAISMAYLIEKPEEFKLKNTEFKIYDDPLQLRNAIIRDEVDISTIPSIMACNLINNGKNLKIVAIPVWGTLHLYGEDTRIQSWEDLRGKEIFMMAQGLTPDILFRALLTAHGLNPDYDVKLNYAFQTHENLANASIAGRAPLAVLSEPLVSMALKKSKKLKRIFNLNNEWAETYGDSIPLAQTALVVNFKNPLITKVWLNEFLNNYAACCIFVNTQPSLTAEFIIKHKIIGDIGVAESAISGCSIQFVRAEEIRQGILNYFDFFYNIDPRFTGGAPANSNMIYTESDHYNN